MAKDTSNVAKDSEGNEFDRVKNTAVGRGIKKLQEKSDEKIAAQARENPAQTAAGNAERLEGLTAIGPTPKNPSVPDPLTPKPTVEPLNDVAEYKKSSKRRGTGRREKTGNLNFGTLPTKPSSPFSAPAATDNRIDRLRSGMGLPGSQNGDLDLALKLHARDLGEARTSGKVVNDVHPTDPSLTSHIQISESQHHTAYARVQRVMGIADHEVYQNAATAAGMRLPQYIAGLHSKVQQHEDSKSMIDMKAGPTDHWLHPKTGEVIPVTANHPDMPMAFMRTKGLVNKVSRGPDGSNVTESGHEGWDRATVRGRKNVLYSVTAPKKGVDLIDHLRVEMLSEHGSSSTSRKRSGSIATDIADVASGAVPRGMKRSGKRKVAGEGFGTEKYVDTYTPAAPMLAQRAFDKPKPPGVRGLTSANSERSTSSIADGQYLLGSKPPTDLPDFITKGSVGKDGRRLVQDKLPGTGVPKTISTEVAPAKISKGEGPLEKRAYELEGTRVGKSTFKLEDFYPTIETAPAVRTTSTIPTDRDLKPQSNLSRGQQFPETETTGLDDLRTAKSAGALVPSGKRAKKTKPMVQPSLFPDFSVKEGRKNAFDTAGSVVKVSEKTKGLQSTATRRFGKREDAIAVEGNYSGTTDAKLEQPEGSRADKKNVKKLADES